MTVAYGLTLSSEEHDPATLVALAQRAEGAGFDFASISDHYHPWTTRQGHSPFVWSVLGAIAASTDRIEVGTGVTCPTTRMHPAIIAQASATAALLFDGRFFLGLGTGEALNEHILGLRWPPVQVRRSMLEDAVEIIRALWAGDTVDRHGPFYDVDNARLFDPPTTPPTIVVSGFGDESVDLAARIGDGYWGHSPERSVIDRYRAAGGHGPRYAQLDLCWAPDEAAARRTVHEIWPNGGIPGQLAQDLPTWTHFEQAATLVDEQHATAEVPCGPDPEPVLRAVESYLRAGYDHLYFHQIGPDQDGFLDFWRRLRPDLDALSASIHPDGERAPVGDQLVASPVH